MKTFQFGQYTCPANQLFITTKHSLGFVNLKPIVPGHVLVIPKRVLKRFNELTKDEVADLYQTAQLVGNAIEKEYNAEALTISMQDGVAAGQSVYHVHVHILPRKPGDFERNDDIYEELDKNGKEMKSAMADSGKKGVDADEDRKPRTPQVMAEEARQLRRLFPQIEGEIEE